MRISGSSHGGEGRGATVHGFACTGANGRAGGNGDYYIDVILPFFHSALYLNAYSGKLTDCVQYGVDDNAIVSHDAAHLLTGAQGWAAQGLFDARFQLFDAEMLFGGLDGHSQLIGLCI